jgi:Tol biopolymer transport system component
LSGVAETAAALTDPGVVLGTVGYMAPEQVRAEAADARADLFALGVVLYEMLTGQRAFHRDTAAETMTAILREDPQAHGRADLPLAIERIVQHSLEKNPAERFQSARDVAFALESSSDSNVTVIAPGSAASPSVRSNRGRSLAAVVTLAVLVLMIWLAWRTGLFRKPSGDAAISRIEIGTATQVTADDGLEIDPALSPDGRLLAYSAGKATQMRIFIRPVSGGRTITLSERTEAFEFQPRWSLDGNQILYLTREGAFVASALGGTSRKVVDGDVGAAAWSPDAKQLVIARDRNLSIAQVAGGEERSIGSAEDGLHSCEWSPRGNWVACVVGNRNGMVPGSAFGNIAPSAIVLVQPSGGRFIDVTDRTSLNQSPVWSPDGRQLFFVSNRQGPRDIYVVDIATDGQVNGEPRRVSTGLAAQSIAFSAKAERLVYVAYAARANIWSLPVPSGAAIDTSGARAVTSGDQIIEALRIPRDGRWLLYDSNLYLNAEIFRVPLAGGPPERLTTDPADDFAPDLSPNGREFAYHSWRTGTRDIFVRKIDGGSLQQVTSTQSQEGYPIWSPDGRALVFQDQFVEGGMSRGLFIVRRDASGNWSRPVLLRKGISPHGTWVSDRALGYPHNGALEIIAADSGTAHVAYTPRPGTSDPAVESVEAAENGRTLYFKSHDAEGRASIWAVAVAGGKPRLLVRFTDPSRVYSAGLRHRRRPSVLHVGRPPGRHLGRGRHASLS